MIGRSGERGSGISVLVARHDDDDDDDIFMQIVLFQIIQFIMSTQFNCQNHFYFKLFSLVKQF